MQFKVFAKLIRMLPTERNGARTIQALADDWPEGDKIENKKRRMHDWIGELSAGISELDVPPLVEETGGHPNRYYLDIDAVGRLFMTDEAALFMVLARPALGPLANCENIGGGVADRASEQLRRAPAGPRLQRIRDRIRVVPDGIGRLYATVDPNILKVAIEAVVTARKISFVYVSAHGNRRARTCEVLGLVAKDRSIYLIASPSNPDDNPSHLPLHRFDSMELADHILAPHRFDLDDYIRATHQLSHPIGAGVIRLELRVAPEMLYHFKEWPLADNQRICNVVEPDGWSAVQVIIPNSVLLVPWLLSMGGWIEVVGPPEVRDEVAKRVKAMAAHYN